jgi:hypothetical protein
MSNTTSFTFKTIAEIQAMRKAGELRVSHSAKQQGYVSRKSEGIVREYNGKFGTGYVIDSPCFDSTRYFNRTYYIAA